VWVAISIHSWSAEQPEDFTKATTTTRQNTFNKKKKKNDQ
jgi:hypothetical protein